MFCNLSIIRFFTVLESSRSLYKQTSPSEVFFNYFFTSEENLRYPCIVKCDRSSVYSSWRRPCKFIEYVLFRVLLHGNNVHLLVVVPTTLRLV